MDIFGDRMKEYESKEASRKFIPLLPIIVRLDGKNFSKWTKGLVRPYDIRLSNIMANVTRKLVKETNALVGYTQSDEISLILYSDNYKSQVYFDGRIMKINSSLASIASVTFNGLVEDNIPERSNFSAYFDCRCWQVPNSEEAVNSILWREIDATKNSVSMAARHYYSHNDILDKGRADMMDMLMEKGVNWNDYPAFFKRGVFIQRKKIKRKFTCEEIKKLPEKHEARINPDLEIERTDFVMLDMPPFAKVINRVGVIFNGHNPIVDEKGE